MVTKVVVVNKGGDLKDVTVKDFDISNLYKKCGFRKAEGFELRHKFEKVKVNGERYDVHVYSRNNGKSGTENKYDMPPPIDNDLYFGNFALVRWCRDEEDYVDLTVDDWKKVYNKLFKGFDKMPQMITNDIRSIEREKDFYSTLMNQNCFWIHTIQDIDCNDHIDNIMKIMSD